MRTPAAAVQSPGGGDLAVTGVRGWPLREPSSGRRYTVIRVDTRAGISGWGECASPEISEIARVLTGTPATAYEVVRRRLAAKPELEAAANMALLDILGKRAKAPVYQVLGGPTRNKARALGRIDGSVESMQRARAAGHRAFLVPAPAPAWPNSGKAYVLAVRQRMDALRAAAGDDADFALDGGGLLAPGDASSVAAELERFHLLWFDEPCRVANLAAIRKIADESVTPLGFGRTIDEASSFQDLLREDAIDVLRPSLARNSIAQIRRMAALAETYYVAVAPYHDGGPVATAAALHLAASLPNFFIQQIPLPASDPDRRMRAEIAGASLEAVREGYAALPGGPGLGITVSEAALEKYKERA
ncbi:MAG: enolase C-terminal domain-like protein [Bryobacteraceae bacterium]